ncbi:hypothetical protein DM860_008086 [Cuscuta australis]|uniref:glucan endo-1,3-beta-D-glucosidase n=1 Tax=Cuscuta australis TaxID=267555 RepID=A0A328D392_9ASTE|nr:hypothetical protein DM860_008086 [Cuscuta australis]
MMLKLWPGTSLLICGLLSEIAGAFVGINVGTDVTDMPSASDTVALLQAHQITHVRLFDADARMLKALSHTGIEVTVGVTNDEVLRIGESSSMAAAWVNKNVAAYISSTNITAIAVGSEVLTSIPNAAPVLVPALQYLHKALVAADLNDRVKVSTPQSMDIIMNAFPPSTATFKSSWNSTVLQILQFLKSTNSYFMLNAYPYYQYVQSQGIFPIEYALFQRLSSVKQVVDPNTLFHYNSMFDAMVDAAYNAISSFNFSDIPVVVTETGWPWFGGTKEPDATVQNAEAFNKNLIQRVLNDSGPPSQLGTPISAYIYELFNEDKRPGPISERNWGIYFPNGTAVYPLLDGGAGKGFDNSSAVFCVAKPGADPKKLQSGLNWACGPGQANCSDIQPGQPCYSPNNLQNLSSYAYNDYYHKAVGMNGTCDFEGTAIITHIDPSYGSCRYTGSSNLSISSLFPPTPFGPAGPETAEASRMLLPCHLGKILAILLTAMLLKPNAESRS